MRSVSLELLQEAAKTKPQGYLDDVLSFVVKKEDGYVFFENDDYYALRDKYTGDVDPLVRGPGTELHKLLSKFGIRIKKGCKCRSRMVQMNQWGCDGCVENSEEILGWLKEEASARKIPFVSAVAKMFLNRAINNARKEASRGKGST